MRHGPERVWDVNGNVIAEGENREGKPWDGIIAIEQEDRKAVVFQAYRNGKPSEFTIEQRVSGQDKPAAGE